MIKKQILISIISGFAGLAIAANANAAIEGPYIGGGLGWGDVHQNQNLDLSSVTSSSSKDTGLAGRVFAGYQLNTNWSLEAGFSKFTNATGKISDTDGFITDNGNATVKSYAVDAVVKINLPLQDGFNLYGKVGGAYLNEAASVTVTETDNILGTTSTVNASKTEGKILPTFGLGAGYDINHNVSADVSWMHIQKVGNVEVLENTDLVTVGLTYHFG